MLALKAEYKAIAGVDPPQSINSTEIKKDNNSLNVIIKKINEQGNKVRSLKSNNASKVGHKYYTTKNLLY